MNWPPIEKAQHVALQLGLLLIPERDAQPPKTPHDHLQAIGPMDPLEFASRAIAYCYRFRGSFTSWGRTNQHNADVGGVEDSKHQVWLAGDVVYD